jgi:hypothetical protein
MSAPLDFWSCQDARANGVAVLQTVQAGTMPCDSDKADPFAGWIAGGRAD